MSASPPSASDLELAPVRTRHGVVPVWGRVEGGGRPLLFVIRGALPIRSHMDDLARVLRGADVALVHLPGMHSPFFERDDPGVFAEAYDEVLASLGHQRVAAVGVSVGGVAALKLRSPALRRIILVDTPLTTAELWPVHAPFRQAAGSNVRAGRWLSDLLGVEGDRVVDRDYRSALNGAAAPVAALIGDMALGAPREVPETPSLVSERSRAAYAADGNTEVVMVPGAGHNIGRAAMAFFVGFLQQTLDAVAAEPG